MSANMRALVDLLEELPEDEDDKYDEIPGFEGDVKKITEKAAVIRVKSGDELIMPLSQLRAVGDEVYASKWILEQKGLA